MKRFALLLAITWAPLAGAAYKCVDERGVTHIGDTPPAGCASVMMYEVKPSGAIIRKIEPTPTPEQLKAMKEEAERRRESDRAAAEQKRKDMALLATFSGEREFDVVRDRNIEPIRSRIGNMEERIKVIEQREAKIAEEMEFYKAGKSKAHKTRADAPPPLLVAEIERLTAEKKTLHDNIASHEGDIQRIRARFDADKKRWIELKAGTPAAQAKAEGAAQPARKN